MYRYYVYNKTKKSWHFIELNEEVEIGQVVQVNCGSGNSLVLCECEIIRSMTK